MKTITLLFFVSFGIFAQAKELDRAALPKVFKCQQVLAVYGPFATERLSSKKSFSVISEDVAFINGGKSDDETVITVSVEGEVDTNLIFMNSDIVKLASGKAKSIRGQYVETSSHDETYVDAMTIVDCK